MDDVMSKYKAESNNRIENFMSNISPIHVILFGVMVLILISYSKDNSDPRYLYVVIAVLLGVIAVLYFKPSKERKIIPHHIVTKIAQEELNRMVREGEGFAYDSKVRVMAPGRTNYENDLITGNSGPVSWHIGFEELVHGTMYKKEGVISIHPYEGVVTGIEFRPLGYSGRESKDRDIVPVGIVEGKMKTTDFGKETK